MQRRRLLRLVTVTGATLSLAPWLGACGFRIRGSAQFAYGSVHLGATTPLAEELRLALRGSGLQVYGLQDPPERAQVVLLISGEQRARVVVSRTSNGQVRELQLRLSARITARSARGADLITDLLMEQQRDVSYNETAALAKEAEEEILYRDMQSDLAQQLLRRLATLQPG